MDKLNRAGRSTCPPHVVPGAPGTSGAVLGSHLAGRHQSRRGGAPCPRSSASWPPSRGSGSNDGQTTQINRHGGSRVGLPLPRVVGLLSRTLRPGGAVGRHPRPPHGEAGRRPRRRHPAERRWSRTCSGLAGRMVNELDEKGAPPQPPRAGPGPHPARRVRRHRRLAEHRRRPPARLPSPASGSSALVGAALGPFARQRRSCSFRINRRSARSTSRSSSPTPSRSSPRRCRPATRSCGRSR